MEMRYVADPVRFERMNSQEVRDSFLVDNLFGAGKIDLFYSFDDRAIIGSAVPTKGPLSLDARYAKRTLVRQPQIESGFSKLKRYNEKTGMRY